MRLASLVNEALNALGANRLRTALTMLGVIIGVASVILMLAIGEGSRRRVAESISQLGSNQLVVMAGSGQVGGFRGAAGGLPTLTIADAEAIAELPGARAVAPVSGSTAQVVFGGHNKSTQVTGTVPDYLSVNHIELADGQAFGDVEVRSAANVALVGSTVVRELFSDLPAGQSVVGQTVRVQRQTLQVIGVLRSRGQGFGGQDQDDVLLLPITTAQRKLSGTLFPGSVSTILVEARRAERKGEAEQEIIGLLRQRHRIVDGSDDDFTVRDLAALSESLALVSQVLSVLLGSIAFISLLVGGIGVMNIMLVSVTERTREIGLRMAVGARRASIQQQFLVEALLMSAAGALIGVLLGGAIGWLATRSGALTAVFSSGTIALAVAVALVVGIVFGWWPARRASRLDPVEALRAQ